MTGPAHFTASDQLFLPSDYALSHWGEGQLNGPAVVGLCARELERAFGAPDFLPTRLTVDLFKAAKAVPTEVRVRLVRDGRRVRTAECDVVQGEHIVARAIMVCYRRSAAPPGTQWQPDVEFGFPPGVHDDAARGGYDRVGEDGVVRPHTGSAAGWSRKVGDHQNDSRKRFVDRTVDVVAGQPNSAFVRAAMVAESTSLTTHLGTAGVGYINGDLTVGLSRLPVDEWIGVQADSHWAHDGISVGTATLFDSQGPFGSGMVTAVANPAAQIDFTSHAFNSLRI